MCLPGKALGVPLEHFLFYYCILLLHKKLPVTHHKYSALPSGVQTSTVLNKKAIGNIDNLSNCNDYQILLQIRKYQISVSNKIEGGPNRTNS